MGEAQLEEIEEVDFTQVKAVAAQLAAACSEAEGLAENLLTSAIVDGVSALQGQLTRNLEDVLGDLWIDDSTYDALLRRATLLIEPPKAKPSRPFPAMQSGILGEDISGYVSKQY